MGIWKDYEGYTNSYPLPAAGFTYIDNRHIIRTPDEVNKGGFISNGPGIEFKSGNVAVEFYVRCYKIPSTEVTTIALMIML